MKLKATTVLSPLSPRQRDVLNAVSDFWGVRGRGPKVRELGAVLGLHSSASVQRHLWALRTRGDLEWELNRAGTLRLTEQGKAAIQHRLTG